jgi:hypothetical protein
MMFDFEHFKNARWGELYAFFAAGNPPLALQLLILNTVFLMFLVIRKIKTKYHMRRSTSLAVQALLVMANVAVMFQQDTFKAIGKIMQLI